MVVDPAALSSDIVANAVTLATPAVLWAFLFLLAWEQRPFAESIGFGRAAFWLLLPGAVLASFAIVPFGVISNPLATDLLAVSLGGAIFPLIIGSLALGRVAPPLGRTLGRLLLYLAVESATLFVLVLPVSAPLVARIADGLGGNGWLAAVLLLVPVALAFPVLAFVRAGPPRTGADNERAVPFVLLLTSAVLLLTFAGSQAIPGVGIAEPFPYYFLPPVLAGAVAAWAASRFLPGRERYALPVAYLASTWGVLLGADLLRQPPLYASGPSGIYTVGGAGVLDLVYLSGLLALLAAYAVHRAVGRPVTDGAPGEPVPTYPVTPVGRLARAFRAGLDGSLDRSLEESAGSARDAAAQARRLFDLPTPPPDRPWEGLPVPGWVVSDQANLEAIARARSSDGREGFRAWLTARTLVYLGRDLGQRRFGSIGTRTLGFLIDLVLVTLPAVAVWIGIVLATPGGIDAILTSLPFNAAIYGFIALSFLFLVLAETWTGSSPGKRLVGLVVRDRALRPVRFLGALVRNVSVLPLLTVVGLGGALAVAFGLRFDSLSSVTVGGITLSGGPLALSGVLVFLVGGVGFLGMFAVLGIVLTSERQRFGDVIAGTWVVRRTSGVVPPPGPAGRVPPTQPLTQPPTSAPGEDRSG